MSVLGFLLSVALFVTLHAVATHQLLDAWDKPDTMFGRLSPEEEKAAREAAALDRNILADVKVAKSRVYESIAGHHHWYSDWKMGEAILDSAHDDLPIYTMLEHDDVSSIIELNLRRSGHTVYNEMKINSDGVPVCPIGRKMVCWGKCPGRQRVKWRCPAKVGKWECPTPCSPSDYGRTFYTSTMDNPRLFPRIRRDSKEWRER